MSLTHEDIQRLAGLARLELSDAEISSAEKELDSVLTYVQRLSAVDTTGVEPMSMPAKAEGWREDRFIPTDDASKSIIIENFPDRKGSLLKTPGVFEAPKGGR